MNQEGTHMSDVDWIEVRESQTDDYSGDWEVVISMNRGGETCHITVGATNLDVAAAWEAAANAGRFTPSNQ